MRTERRATVMAIGPDVVRVCEEGCRDYCLDELGLTGPYKASGAVRAYVTWNCKGYSVSWHRCRPSGLPCDQCGNEWETRVNLGVYPPAETRPKNGFKSTERAERGRRVSRVGAGA
jgi:hypothetical protein